MLLDLKRIKVPPGQRVLLQDVTWQEFETILAELGEHRAARIAYSHGVLELMMPLPEYELNQEIVGELVKALLEELKIKFITLDFTTFKNQQVAQGIEPDQFFYIKNEILVRGKEKIDLTIDPPPDLAIEIDVTSRTHPHIYQALKVPELWQFNQGQLRISVLRNGRYVESQVSSTFSTLPLIYVIPRYLQQTQTAGKNAAIKTFRRWVQQL